MGYSAWKIWMHPGVTGHVMAELEGETESLRRRVSEQDKALGDAGRETEGLKEELGQLREEVARLKGELAGRQEEVSHLREELAGRREAAEIYAEVEENMKRVGEMKEKYEKRISHLREEIVRLKTASGSEKPEAGELSEIDMRGEVIAPRPGNTVQMPDQTRRRRRDEGDWLELL